MKYQYHTRIFIPLVLGINQQ